MEISKQDSLKYAIDNGILNLDEIEIAVQKMKEKELLKQHQYSIWQDKSGKWLTHIRDDKGKLVVRRRKSREELEAMIIQHISNVEDVKYIADVFNEWIDEKLRYGEIKKQSYDRYKSDYERFFHSKAKICNKTFKSITEDDLEEFIKVSIHDKKLTRKTYSGLVTLLNGIFKYGKKHKYTDFSITNFFGDLELSKNIFQKKYKDKATQIFNEDEIPKVIQYLRRNTDIWNLGLLLQFQTGMRIGEVAALKYEDISDDCICVKRTEVKYKDISGSWKVRVDDIPKTDAGYREIIIPPNAKETIRAIKEINPNGEFVFMNKGKRIRENTFNKRLGRICEDLNMIHKSSHKIRRTYGTTLLDSNVNDSIVAEQMGHKDVITTRKLYYYSNKNRNTKITQIAQAVDF